MFYKLFLIINNMQNHFNYALKILLFDIYYLIIVNYIINIYSKWYNIYEELIEIIIVKYQII